MTAPFRRCARCVMDTTDPEITFGSDGICHHCRHYEARVARELYSGEKAKVLLQRTVDKIRADGQGREYDCVLGVSGGVDSTYVAYLTKQLGLRPLAIHFDNGWNSELAVHNIQRALDKLQIPLFTYVVDWHEFRDLQLSFLRASVANSEIPTDHAITALLFRTAVKHKVRYIMAGSNLATEGIHPPLSWGYEHRDWKHIKALHKRFGTQKLKTFPHYSLAQMAHYIFVKKIQFVRLLNMTPYRKEDVIETLGRELGWQYYGAKHYESIYTRFFQGYILPTKFGFDKRKPHLSSLINSGQMSREQALDELTKPTYPADLLIEDKAFVAKKFGLSEDEFDALMRLPNKTFLDYPSNYHLLKRARKLVDFAKRTATQGILQPSDSHA